MSNPFDQFAVDVQAALPSAPPPGPTGNGDVGNPFATVFNDAPNLRGPPPPVNKPVMNAPPMVMNGGSMNGGAVGYGGGYGQPAPPTNPMSMYGDPNAGGGMYGQPPPAPPQESSDPFGGGAYGMPPPPQGPPPSMYGSMGPPPVAAPQGPPPPSPSPYGAPSAAMQPSQPSPNPYGAPSNALVPSSNPTPNPYALPPAPFQAGGDPYGAQQQPPPPPPSSDPFGASTYGARPPGNPYGAPQMGGPPPPSSDPFASYGAPPPPAPPAPPANDPFGGYGMPPASENPYGAPPPGPPPQQQPQQAANPYGDPFTAAPPQDPGLGALVPSNQPYQPYAQIPPQQQNPYGQPPGAPPAIANDPFSVFESAPAPAAPPAPPSHALVPSQGPPPQQQAPPPASDGDLWGDLGFDAPPSSTKAPEGASVQEEKKESGDLPPGGEFYDARIFTPTLGVMFFKPQELTDSLFLNTDRGIVDALNERPVVAFIVEGSSARSAGVELGHVLLKVNGVDVKNPKEASRLIKEGPRPLPLMFYVPNTDVVVAEGEHMVKYDTKETTAPNSAKDWKPKYVVIGGIIAQPWMMNMYRSKSEYDIAVIETQARRPVSVKVKQFSLQGARIQNDWQGPQMVKYKNKLHPWKYIVVLPVARNPIKISSPNLAQLKPVHEGIRRVLLAQQRSRGGNSHTAAPVSNRDPYSQQEYNQPPPQQGALTPHQQQYPQNAGYAQPSGYTGGY
ncbi:hypothetical protein IV203_035704 [Nitzschia inconspicua]|uniref:PDZ domain-containing protein n=1 Tax=Nitzschia inconspicua TaxID=303405 RepID=A0A9K3LDT5_9STRA|nr:hypothetical protein IV203_035704 [Nitzschia inconspicua]